MNTGINVRIVLRETYKEELLKRAASIQRGTPCKFKEWQNGNSTQKSNAIPERKQRGFCRYCLTLVI